MAELGIHELRADLASRIRRAAAGEATVVTINGRPSAVLGPIDASAAEPRPMTVLIAAGAVIPPRRPDRDLPQQTLAVWGTVRLDRLLREVRG